MRHGIPAAALALWCFGCSSQRPTPTPQLDQLVITATNVQLRGAPSSIGSGLGAFPGVVIGEPTSHAMEFVGPVCIPGMTSFGVVDVTLLGATKQPKAVAVGYENQIGAANSDKTLSVFLPSANPPRID